MQTGKPLRFVHSKAICTGVLQASGLSLVSYCIVCESVQTIILSQALGLIIMIKQTNIKFLQAKSKISLCEILDVKHVNTNKRCNKHSNQPSLQRYMIVKLEIRDYTRVSHEQV